MFKFNRSNHKTAAKDSDEALLAAYLRTGEARILGELYERYMPMVYGVCLKILRDPGKAEDAVMGIYEELAVKASEHQIEVFRGWLYVLARNYCLMEWRKQKRRPTDLHPPENMHLYDAVEQAFEIEFSNESNALHDCLGQLPELQLTCVRFFYFEDKSYKEIAGLLAEEIGKVRSHIQNGRRNLKNCLEKNHFKSEY